MKAQNRQLLACLFGLAAFAGFMNSAGAASGTINNDAWLKSTDGNPVFAHSAYLTKIGGTYYLYGQEYQGSAAYYQNGTINTTTNAYFASTNVYTSTDLINWTPKAVAWNGSGYVATGDWVGRLWGVLYNAANRQYVMWMKYQGGNGSGVLCLTSSSPTGPFAVDHLMTSLSGIYGTPPYPGDAKFFIDPKTNAPYLACSDSHGRQRAYVVPLSADYKSLGTPVLIATWAQGQEANNMFYVPATSKYYYFSSDTNGWSYSAAYCVSSSSISSGYSKDANLSGSTTKNSYWSQVLQATTVTGTSGSVYMMLCDRWNLFSSNYGSAGHGVGYNVWEPLTITSNKTTFNALATWQLDAAAGTWTN